MGQAVCTSDSCPGLSILGISLYFYGAAYYAAAALLILAGRKEQQVFWFLLAGCAFHTVLIGYGWAAAGTLWFCTSCLRFWGLLVTLTAAYGGLIYKGKRLLPAWAVVGVFIMVMGVTLAGLEAQETGAGESVTAAAEQVAPGFMDAYTLTGDRVRLDLAARPVLLFSWQCKYCPGVLKAASEMDESIRPVLVEVHCSSGDAAQVEQKLSEAGLSGVEWFCLSGQPPPEGVPALIWWQDGKAKELLGGPAIEAFLAGGSG